MTLMHRITLREESFVVQLNFKKFTFSRKKHLRLVLEQFYRN